MHIEIFLSIVHSQFLWERSYWIISSLQWLVCNICEGMRLNKQLAPHFLLCFRTSLCSGRTAIVLTQTYIVAQSLNETYDASATINSSHFSLAIIRLYIWTEQNFYLSIFFDAWDLAGESSSLAVNVRRNIFMNTFQIMQSPVLHVTYLHRRFSSILGVNWFDWTPNGSCDTIRKNYRRIIVKTRRLVAVKAAQGLDDVNYIICGVKNSGPSDSQCGNVRLGGTSWAPFTRVPPLRTPHMRRAKARRFPVFGVIRQISTGTQHDNSNLMLIDLRLK